MYKIIKKKLNETKLQSTHPPKVEINFRRFCVYNNCMTQNETTSTYSDSIENIEFSMRIFPFLLRRCKMLVLSCIKLIGNNFESEIHLSRNSLDDDCNKQCKTRNHRHHCRWNINPLHCEILFI